MFVCARGILFHRTTMYPCNKAKDKLDVMSGIHWKISVKVNSSLCFLTEHHTTKAYLALDGGEWSASRPSRFIPREKAPPSTHWIGSWLGPRAGRDAVASRQNPIIAPAGNWNPVIQPVS